MVAHPAEVFLTYALPLLKPHAVLLMISAGESRPESEELARMAAQRGCVVVVLANSAENALMKFAHYPLLISGETQPDSPSMTVCLQTALNFFAFEAAQSLKRPEPHWKQVSEEFEQLPEKIDWLFTQLPALVRSLAGEISKLSNLQIVGGGFYEFPARRAARRLQTRRSLQVEALEPSGFLNANAAAVRAGEAALFLSGSHSKIKKLTHRCAEQARTNGARVLSMTDGNDRELSTGSDLGLLIPTLHEAPSSTITLFMLEWLISEILHTNKP